MPLQLYDLMLLLPAAAGKEQGALVPEAECGSLQESAGPRPPGRCVVCRYDGPLSSRGHCFLEVGLFRLRAGYVRL